jgi:transposase-like protein
MTMMWKDLSAEERYRVVEMAMTGQATVKELSQSFRASPKTLYKAIEEARAGAVTALEPKKPGRKPTPIPDRQATESKKEKEAITRELEHWKTKYEIAKTFLDLQRQDLSGTPASSPTQAQARTPGKKKKTRLRRIRRAPIPGPTPE